MITLQNMPCEFSKYAQGLDLSSAIDRENLTIALNRSFTFISNLSADKYRINGQTVEKLCKIMFESKSHTFVPQPTSSSLLAWVPGKVWHLLGYEEEASGPKNLEGMLIFIAHKLSKLAKMKFGSTNNDTLTKYLLINYNSMHMGITTLKEYYRRFVPTTSKMDDEEKTLERCLDLHETITVAAALIADYSSGEIYELSNSFLSTSKAYDLLSLEINAPIKNIMSLGKNSFSDAYIQAVFQEGSHFNFMTSCLKLDAELFPQILDPLSHTLEQAYENRFNSSNHYLAEFYLQILKSEYFKELHLHVVVQLMKKKRYESEKDFQIQSQPKAIKEVYNFINQKIKEIKKHSVTEQQKKQLNTFLEAIDEQLENFFPFKQIYNFALVYSDQIAADNNPGLPFKALGVYEIRNFVVEVLFSFDDLETVNLSDTTCRKKLLNCAEFVITNKFSKALQSVDNSIVDLIKLNSWLRLFPEVTQLSCWPLIEKFCIINNVKIPF